MLLTMEENRDREKVIKLWQAINKLYMFLFKKLCISHFFWWMDGWKQLNFFHDTLENFGDTQMCRDTRFEKHCFRWMALKMWCCCNFWSFFDYKQYINRIWLGPSPPSVSFYYFINFWETIWYSDFQTSLSFRLSVNNCYRYIRIVGNHI